MRHAIAHFLRFLEGAPLLTAREAEQYDGARCRRTDYYAKLARLWVKGTAHCETHQGGAPA